MKNKRRLKAILLAALAAVGTLLLSSCSSEKTVYTGRRKVFETGEHTITQKINTTNLNKKIDCPDGYEIISMGVTGGNNLVFLLRNTTNVECVETDLGYNQPGTPVEKVLKLTQEE